MLRDLFKIKDADKTEENLLHILSVMSENKKYILKKSIEILAYCKKKFENHTPFIRAYFYGHINPKSWNDYDLVLNYNKENKPIVNILRWRRDDSDSMFEYQLLGLIPSDVLISDDWKKLCKEEFLRKKNESEINKIENEKLQKIQKEKEELENYIELKKKFGGSEDVSEINKIENEKLQKIQKEKEELENYIELKKKFGGSEDVSE